ncbi:hypothetical protein [Falsiroseomonas sp. E2-1-a4]|uniref:hypothetical protein n=1 Tax=Falsiroseomonas sp. E2-1-a4 TaxID=3239299 RepID=UPI003F591541
MTPRSCFLRSIAWESSPVPVLLTIIAGRPRSAMIRLSLRPIGEQQYLLQSRRNQVYEILPQQNAQQYLIAPPMRTS